MDFVDVGDEECMIGFYVVTPSYFTLRSEVGDASKEVDSGGSGEAVVWLESPVRGGRRRSCLAGFAGAQ